MTLDSNTHPLDELAVYALNALDPAESAAIEAHLATCAACRAELDRHLATLAQVVAPEEPPPGLWDRIAGQLPARDASGATGATPDAGDAPDAADVPDADLAPVVPFDPERPRHAGPRRRTGRIRPTTWLAAVAAVAVLVVGIAVGSLRSRGGPESLTDLAQAAVDDPGSAVVELTGNDGRSAARVVLTDQSMGYVLLDDLPTLPAGRSYQLWKMNDTPQPVSLGVIGDGSAEAAVFALPSDSTSFAITEEPDVGVPAPTGDLVADGQLDPATH